MFVEGIIHTNETLVNKKRVTSRFFASIDWQSLERAMKFISMGISH